MIKAFALTLTLCLGFNAVSWAQDRPAAEAGPRAWRSGGRFLKRCQRSRSCWRCSGGISRH